MAIKIYALMDERGNIRYIGKTIKTLGKRLAAHVTAGKCKTKASVAWWAKQHRTNWIGSLLAQGHRPGIMLVGEYEGDGNKEERAWIAYFRAEGLDLVNGTDGGDGANGADEDARRRMRLALLGNKHSGGHKKKLRQAANEYWHHPVTVAKRREKKAERKRIWEEGKPARIAEGKRKSAVWSKSHLQSQQGRENSRTEAIARWARPSAREKQSAVMKQVARREGYTWPGKTIEGKRKLKQFWNSPAGKKIASDRAKKQWRNPRTRTRKILALKKYQATKHSVQSAGQMLLKFAGGTT